MVMITADRTRASKEKDMNDVRKQITSLITGSERAKQSKVLKGWTANNNYGMREVLQNIYFALFKQPLVKRVYHAGLEAGAFAVLFPYMDIKSIGSLIRGAHGTKERLHIASYNRFIQFLFTIAYVHADLGKKNYQAA